MTSERSNVILFDPNAKTGEFKRPDHNDFATTTELKQRQFTGVRDNSITAKLEFWILGEIRKEVDAADVVKDPGWIQTTFQELFHLR